MRLSHLFAQGWQGVSVLDGLGREDSDLVAVDLDGALSRRRSFASLKPTLDVSC